MDLHEHSPPSSQRECSQKKCKAKLPSESKYKWKTCQQCRDWGRLHKQAKRKNDRDDDGPRCQVVLQASTNENEGEERQYTIIEDDRTSSESESNHKPITFENGEELMKSLRQVFKTNKMVFFYGCYQKSDDPLVSDKEHIQMTAYEIWRVSGYRFHVKENIKMVTGHKTRYWCCQDQDRKQKARPSQQKGAKPRDTLGMHRYNCKSRLNISCRDDNSKGTYTITIWLTHKASALIRQDLEWMTPSTIAKKVYPAWITMSEILWKRDHLQLASASILLQENSEDVDVFDIPTMDSIEQLAWGMKRIAM
ncbi:hypothetical protein BU17DRAFT_70752 [Hysterangium stoloniferum]|nr:hypothetical protein BU17DRAFT_70752 [Hysterangium stoloniferum]